VWGLRMRVDQGHLREVGGLRAREPRYRHLRPGALVQGLGFRLLGTSWSHWLGIGAIGLVD